MFMLRVFRNITGYVKFYGKGVFPERFLNLCAKENILVWNSKVNVNEMTGCMHIHDYKNIKKIAKKSSMRLKITKKRGLPFLVNRYKHRYGIPVGVFIFFFLLWFLSGFCFNITIVGNTDQNKDTTLAKLKDCGVYCGQRISNINPEEARQKFLIKNKEFSWAAINIKGSYITVDLVKTTEKKMNKTSYEPCNIIANSNGKILRIKAYEGKISVKIGEAVAKGDLLVSGVIELTNKSTKFVHANAEVIAQTRHKLKVFVPYKNKELIKTDEIKKRSVLTIGNLDIPLFFGDIEKPYKTSKKIKNYKLGGEVLPIKLTTVKFTKYRLKNITLDKESAKILAREEMKKKSEKELKNLIKSSNSENFKETKKGIIFTKVFICEENISLAKKILK